MDSIEKLNLILAKSENIFERVNFETNDIEYFVMMGAFASMIEQTKAYIYLYKANHFSSTSPIARAIIELYIDIKNIDKELTYVNYLMSEYYNREKDSVKSQSKKKDLKKKRNVFYSKYKSKSLDNEYEELTIRAKLRTAGLLELYELYGMLSGNTHSGIYQFLNIMDDGKNKKDRYLNISKSEASVLEKAIVPYISSYVIDACKVIASGFDKELSKEVDEFYNTIALN